MIRDPKTECAILTTLKREMRQHPDFAVIYGIAGKDSERGYFASLGFQGVDLAAAMMIADSVLERAAEVAVHELGQHEHECPSRGTILSFLKRVEDSRAALGLTKADQGRPA